MKTPLEILREARELISDPERRCTCNYALNAQGENTQPEFPDAVKWCSLGAIDRAAYGASMDACCKAKQYLDDAAVLVKCLPALPLVTAFAVNDCGTHEQVLAMWDRAIELAESEAV